MEELGYRGSWDFCHTEYFLRGLPGDAPGSRRHSWLMGPVALEDTVATPWVLRDRQDYA